tara:strand:+ start:451 stop:1089 length:639 start_codon:yes stop_codon:yes gene_type:complete
MEVKLSEIRTKIISLPTETQRRENMKSLLDGVEHTNYEFFDSIKTQPYWIGCGLSHRECLAFEEAPLLTLEDDVAITEHYRDVIDIPEEADIVYLGCSHWGTKSGTSQLKGVNYEKYNEDYYRVSHMVGAHAILYMNNKAIKDFSGTIVRQLFEVDRPFDEVYARLQEKYVILTPTNPFYYQNCEKNEVYTRPPLHAKYIVNGVEYQGDPLL